MFGFGFSIIILRRFEEKKINWNLLEQDKLDNNEIRPELSKMQVKWLKTRFLGDLNEERTTGKFCGDYMHMLNTLQKIFTVFRIARENKFKHENQ